MSLAYTPFIDPINAHDWWYLLLVPLALGIAVVYKAVRMPTLESYPKQVLIFSAQIVLGVVLLGAASFLFIQFVLPAIAPMPRW